MEGIFQINVLLFFSHILLLRSAVVGGSGVCPRYCTCYMWDGLRRADCINQRLVNIDVDISPAVEAFDLSNNSITSLENRAFQDLGLIKLIHLNLQFNKISSVSPHAFAGLEKLQTIDLSQNRLHYLLPRTFLDTPLLNGLFLSNNKFGRILGPFLDSPSLKVLDISHCQLGDLHAGVLSQLPSLENLSLADNQLTRINMNMLRPFIRLVHLNLSKNPWPCDGDTRDLQEWLKMRGIPDTTQCTTLEQKLEKIISLVTVDQSESNSMEEDISKFWFEINERDKNDVKDEKNVTIHDNSKLGTIIYESIDKIPSFWALIIGLEVGSVFTMFGMFIWLRCSCVSKDRVRHFRRPMSLRLTSHDSNVLWTELETTNCPDTPPPPYHSLSGE